MAKLNLLFDGKSLSEFALDKERITIGRRPSNDIHIDNLAVSGEHAVVITIGSDSFLEDLNSTNGTLVNQKLIKKHVLQHNDLIEFGKHQLKYLTENLTENTPTEEKTTPIQQMLATEATHVAPTPVSQAVIETPTPAPAEAKIEHAAGYLEVQTGKNAGQHILLNRSMVKLGTPGVQLALITKRQNGYFLTHVEGQQFPKINGQSIGMQAHHLSSNDMIELADFKAEFFA